MSKIFTWIGLLLVAFGTTSDWKGWCLDFGIVTLFLVATWDQDK